MMRSFLSHALSNREKCMLLALLVLLVIGLYFFAVQYPIAERTAAIEQENTALDDELATAQAKADEYNAMKAEIDEIMAQPQDQITLLPPYSNIETLMQVLNVIFAGTNADFSFSQPRITENVAARTISFSCTAADYAAARRLLHDVAGTQYRSLLDSFTLTPAEEGGLYGGPLQVSGSITFYERMPVTETEPEAEADGSAEEPYEIDVTEDLLTHAA